MKQPISLLTIALLALIAIPCAAQTIYDNGPINGNSDAWTINFGYIVSDTFTVGSEAPASVTGLSFGTWMFPGDVLESAEVSITSEEFGGTSYFDQTISFTQSGCIPNDAGYDICTESASFTGPQLSSGTYWLNLQNATVANDDPVYWDENSGPSNASESAIGTIPSESFTVLGGSTCNGCACWADGGCGPEPNTISLLGSGALAIFGALGVMRRKLF